MEAKKIDDLIIKTIGVEYPSLIQSELPYYRAIAEAFYEAGIEQGKAEARREMVEFAKEISLKYHSLIFEE